MKGLLVCMVAGIALVLMMTEAVPAQCCNDGCTVDRPVVNGTRTVVRGTGKVVVRTGEVAVGAVRVAVRAPARVVRGVAARRPVRRTVGAVFGVRRFR
jgi:hypothetical protein